jgi:hypothetical protein
MKKTKTKNNLSPHTHTTHTPPSGEKKTNNKKQKTNKRQNAKT